MYEVIFLFVLGFIYVLFASIEDLRKREVANWLNFSLIIFALGFRFFYCLFLEPLDFNFFYQGLIGLGIFFIIGNAFYYGKIFAGGDAKLMIALGSVFPINSSFFHNIMIYSNFLIIFLFSSFFYTVFYSIFLVSLNFKRFKKEFKSQIKTNKKIIYLGVILGIVSIFLCFLVLDYYDLLLVVLGFVSFSMPFVYIYASSVDKVSMIKKLNPKEITEGDWLYKDIKIGNKMLKANWDGLSKKEIQLIRKNNKSVLIRQGIPFVPVFFISFLILMIVVF